MLQRTKASSHAPSPKSGSSRKVKVAAAVAAIVGLFGTGIVTGAGTGANAAPIPVGNGFTVTAGDISFILNQIKIAERHVRSINNEDPTHQQVNPNPLGDPNYCASLVAGPLSTGVLNDATGETDYPDQIPDYLTAYGLRTVDGSCNNLTPADLLSSDGTTPVTTTGPAPTNVKKFFNGQADQPFPRLTTPVFRDADTVAPGSPFAPAGLTSYKQKQGNVVDSEPRTVSNLIDDQTSTNPAAIAAAGAPVRTQAGAPGIHPCTTDPDTTVTPAIVGVPAGCTPSHKTLFIPNVTTDVGLSPPYNSLFTFFGQFFDHGVDQTVKSGATVFIPLKADDPLRTVGPDGKPGTGDEVPANQAFMALTRAQNQPGPDGVIGDNPATPQDESADDIQNPNNTDTPWVDQSQTYTSHSAHQVYLREYAMVGGKPVATGKLLGGLPADGSYAGSPDGQDGISTWAAVKKQAAEKLGLLLTDYDVNNIPQLFADPYGNFYPGPNGLPQYMLQGGGLLEGNLTTPVPVPANVLHFDTPFLTDIAHNADPGPCATPNAPVAPCLVPDADNSPSTDFLHQPAGTYDDEMLNAHFSCGDGRCNENIALSTIHQIFHSEHDRLIDDIQSTLNANPTLLAAFHATSDVAGPGKTFSYGERMFQAARFVTEMEYQHLVFEEFARKVQPAVRPFHVFSPDINTAIPNEFAAAVYRFGHSMLDDDVARTVVATSGPNNGKEVDNSVPLLTAFLNPPEFYNGGGSHTAPLTPREAAGSVVMGSSDQVGNELDEFVTETLRNNLLGLPLDLPTINMARARETGIPPLNEVRRQINARTNDAQLAPYTSWSDYGQHLKHPESLINFVAAYGTHPSIVGATTLVGKRDAARAIVNPLVTDHPPADAADFMFGTGAWASDANGVTTTGLDSVDLWVGGLAEITNLFGGLLGSTFNYVFQNTLENLQDGDRLYYLNRTPGMNLRTQLEGNSFSELIERNTDNTNTLKADAFSTADCKFQIGNLEGTPAGFTAHGATVADDLSTPDCNETDLLLRKPDGTIQYRAINGTDPAGINGQSVYNGSAGNDRVFGGNDNDTFWGNEGNDVLEGNGGDDFILGGAGNDIETDLDGADVLKGGPGNDALDGGPGDDIFMGGDDSDFINGGANDNEAFAGPGNDFIIAGQGADTVQGDGGDDWLEGGSGQDLLIGDHSAPFFDDPAEAKPGNDVFVGQVGENDYDAEGGDDLMAQNAAIDRNAGAAGFDWAFHQYNTTPADDDMSINQQLVGIPLPVVVNRDRWQETEADSGDHFDDVIKGTSDERIPGPGGFSGCDALDQAGIDRIAGLGLYLPNLATADATTATPIADINKAANVVNCPLAPANGFAWEQGNILLGGGGNDLIEGRGNNDIIDGDHTLHVRIEVEDPANPAVPFGSTDLMEHKVIGGGSFGPGTANMTLQQAVFAGLVDPGNLVIKREIVNQPAANTLGTVVTNPNNGLAGDCGPGDTTANAVNFGPVPNTAPGHVSVNCDTASYSKDPTQYTVQVNIDGSVTVSDAAAAAGGIFGTGDGVDTLWNVEVLRFCVANDAVTKLCTRTLNRLVSDFGAAPIAASQGLSALAQNFLTAVGTLSTEQTTTVTNTGTAPLIVSSVALSGPNADQFLIVGNTCDVAVTPGLTCAVKTQFAPTSAGTKTATLTITSNAANSPSTVTLTGTASGPATTAPGAPTIGTATAANGQATATWTAPGSNGGSAITGYSVRVVDAGTNAQIGALHPAGAGASSLVVAGLTNGTAIEFQVSATNAVGTSPLSALSNSVTPVAPVTAPGAPTIGTATGGNATATVSWSAPASNGGSAITGYSVKVINTANAQVGALRPAPAGATSLVVTGLTNGTAVRFQVSATNAIGTGALSALSNSVTPVAPPTLTAPGAPSIGAASAGNATVTVNWSAPASDGGTAVTGYSVRVVRASNNAQVGALRPADAGATSLAVTGLSNGTAYRIQVRATNSVGSGPYSALSTSVTPATTPSAPVNRTPTRGSNGGAKTASANWSPGNTGGSAITGYRVYAQVMSSAANSATPVGPEQVSAILPASARSASFTFASTVNVRFQVEAINALGTSPRTARSANVVPR